jgi:hypothetical protein
MATETKTPAAPKAKKPPVAVAARIEDMLMKAVLGKKVTKEDMARVKEQVDRLIAFMG